MLVALVLAAANIQVSVTVNGIESGRACRIQNMATEAETGSGEAAAWDLGKGVDIRIFCRRATGDLMRIVEGVKGKKTIDLKMGFAIFWIEREGERINGRSTLKRIGGKEKVLVKPGAQTPLLVGNWNVETFDDSKKAWREDRISIRQGATIERTIDLAPGKIRVNLSGGKGQVDLIGPGGSSAGYGPAGTWIQLPPNRYRIMVTRQEDLAQIMHPVGEVLLRPEASVARQANPILGILRWRLKERLGELKLYNEDGSKLLAEGLTGDRWKASPGHYRVAYQLPSNEILGLDFGAKTEAVEIRAGRSTQFGSRPQFGEVVVRLRRGNAPQFGSVELLNPADGELVGRFPIGQMVRIAKGRWPLRVIASDGKVIPYGRPLVISAGGKRTVDLQRQQSRLRITLSQGGQRAKGLWQVMRQTDGEPLQGVSGEAMDLDAGKWILRVKCATGRGGQEREIVLKAGTDVEEEFLCN